jgi:hypothetical protein
MVRCRSARAVEMWRARFVFAVVCALISRISPAWAFAPSFSPSEAWTASRAQRQLAEDDASGAFSSWLAAFAFTFPNEKFVLQYARIQVELSGLCTNTRIGKVISELNVKAAQLAVDVNDVEFDCALSWMVEDYYGNRAVGDARANVSQSSAQAAVAIDVDDELRPPLPREVRLTNCAMNLIVQELAFSGGNFASILNAASVAIRKELGRSLNTASCKQATKALQRFSETTLPQEERALAQYFTPIDPLPFPIHAHAVDLGSSKLRRWLAFMVEHYISAQQGTRSIGAFAKWLEDQNERNHAYNAKVIQVPPLWLIDPETKQPKLSVAMPRDILGDALDDLRFIVYEMKILGLETANALHGPDVVMSGNNSSELLTSFNFGVGWEKITLNVSGVLEVLPTAVELDPFLEPLTVSFELRNPQFNATFGLAIDSIAIAALRGARATNPSCLASTFIQTRVRALDFSGAPAEVIITPWRIGKAANASDDTLEASLDRLIAQASKLLAETLSEALEDTIKHQLGSTVRGAFEDALQRRIESLQAENACPTMSKASLRLSALKLGLSTAFLYGAGVCLVLFSLLMFGYSSIVVFAWKCTKKTYTLLWRCVHGDDDEHDGAHDEENSINTTQAVATPQSSRRNYSRAMFNRGGGDDDDDDVSATIDDDTSMITESLLGDAEIDDEGNIDIDAKSLSRRQAALYKSLVVSKRAQFGLPILYVMAVMLFLASNLRVGATVNVRASMGSSGLTDNISDAVIIHDVFIFGLGDTVTNMWRAGVYVLSILILLFSGVWPYVKLALMFKAWFLPFDSSKERGALLAKLDAFGKWSLLEAFVMILFMVLFHFEVSTNDGGGGGGGDGVQTFASLTVTVDPKPGFFIFLFATFLSMILGQVTSLYHDLDEADRDEKQHVQQEINENLDNVAVDDEKRSLIWMQATRSADIASQDAAMQITVGVCGSALIIATFVLLMLGMKAIAIEINFLGVAGAALGPTASNKALSLVSVATDVPKTVAYRGVIRATLVTFAFVVPLARIVFVMLLWLAPLTRSQRRAFWRVKDVIDAWSALDVLVFSFVAAMLQIRQFLGFMMGGNCDALNVTLQQLVEGPVNDGRDLCFDVDARIHDGCVLFAMSVCGSLGSTALLNTYKARERNDDDDDER